MTDRSALAWLRDARTIALEAFEIASSFDWRAFERSRRDQFAVQYCLAVVGEALNETPKDVQVLAPDIPWRAAYNLRNRLVHGYWLVDARIVLDIAQKRTQPLATSINQLIETLEQ